MGARWGLPATDLSVCFPISGEKRLTAELSPNGQLSHSRILIKSRAGARDCISEMSARDVGHSKPRLRRSFKVKAKEIIHHSQ